MGSVLTEIIGLLTQGISGIASGIGQGLQTLVTNIFLTGTGSSSDPYKLSVYGGVIIVFAGIALLLAYLDLLSVGFRLLAISFLRRGNTLQFFLGGI